MKKILNVIIIILLISLMLLSSIVLLKNIMSDRKEEIFNNLINTVNENTENNNVDENDTNNYLNLFNSNSDMVAWLKINGTNIDYPVMQTKGSPNYYLRRNFYKTIDLKFT